MRSEDNGFAKVVNQAMAKLSERFDHIGVSLDLDLIDPQDFAAVSTPEPGGISYQVLKQTLAEHIGPHPKLIGVEVVEFNSQLDPNGQHADQVCELINSMLG